MKPGTQKKLNTSDGIKKFLHLFPYIVILAGLIVVVYTFVAPLPPASINSNTTIENSTKISYIAAISAFFTVVLTGLYVVVNSKQLDVMEKQLKEMKSGRELQNQPLPWISNVKFSTAIPCLFSSPEGETHIIAYSRYFVDFTIKNLGSSPSICTDVTAFLMIQMNNSTRGSSSTPLCIQIEEDEAIPGTDDNKKKILDSASLRIDTLEEKENYISEDKNTDFMFTDDHTGTLFSRMIEGRVDNYPILKIRVLYRNILGACFILSNMYRLYPVNDGVQVSIFKNWLSQIVSFPLTCNNEIKKLNELYFRETTAKVEEWKTLFQKLEKQFSDSLITRDTIDDEKKLNEEIKEELHAEPLSGSFCIKPISIEEYNEATKDIGYGMRLSFTPK